MEDDTNENNYIRTRAHLYTLEQEQMNQHKEKKPTSGAKNTRIKHILTLMQAGGDPRVRPPRNLSITFDFFKI